jgi:hypothetical protein
MARYESPPFDRGATFYNGATIDSNNLGGIQHEGKEWEFEDLDLSTVGAKAARTNRMVRCRVCRNVAAVALLPKRLASFKVGNPGRVDGYATTTAQAFLGVVDEWLPAAGVPVNDLFWMVVEGPSQMLTDLAGGANNLIPLDTILVGLTAVTSGATTAGRVAPQDLSGVTTALGSQIQNALGRALTAATTANTNTSILVEIFARKW